MSRKERGGSRLVYSSERGRHCPRCQRPEARCVCREAVAPAGPPGDGVVRIRREVKGRRGKCVTTVSGMEADAAAIRVLAADLKRACGTGGAVKEGRIEIQGDQRERVKRELEKRGFRVKLAGG